MKLILCALLVTGAWGHDATCGCSSCAGQQGCCLLPNGGCYNDWSQHQCASGVPPAGSSYSWCPTNAHYVEPSPTPAPTRVDGSNLTCSLAATKANNCKRKCTAPGPKPATTAYTGPAFGTVAFDELYPKTLGTSFTEEWDNSYVAPFVDFGAPVFTSKCPVKMESKTIWSNNGVFYPSSSKYGYIRDIK